MNDLATNKTLFVDDNANLLAGIMRQFRKQYDVVTAQGGKAGLEAIRHKGPFAVIVCDMKMPDMNGIQFFKHAQEIAPDSSRIMLTGNADLETAMHAVNEGNIFRFLMKPCEKATIAWALDSGIEYYTLRKAEKELLEKTLQGCVRALTDMLSLTNPLAFSQASRISNYVKRIVEHLNLKNKWVFELAASLSQIGCISVPRDTLERVFVGGDLSEDEREMYRKHPKVGKIIGAQLSWSGNCDSPVALPERSVIEVGSEIMAVALEFDNMLCQGVSKNQIITDLRKGEKKISATLLDALKSLEIADTGIQTRMVRVNDLTDAMVIAEDLYSKPGTLIASHGQALNYTVRALLSNYALRKEIEEEIRVYTRLEETFSEISSPKTETAKAPQI